MKTEFHKISGAKNIFLVRDKLAFKPQSVPELVKKICDPFEGFCADGVVFVEPVNISKAEFTWDFYNSDGSGAEMCGNAVRCVHSYIIKKYQPKSATISIVTGSGLVISSYKDDFYFVQMPIPKEASDLYLTSEFFNQSSLFREFENVSHGKAYFVDTGVPHLVITVHDWERALSLSPVWLFLRNHSYFKKGTNVTLVQSQKNGSAVAVSFERGVDDFTQACGTGAVAAALFVGHNENIKSITITMPGGELKVNLAESHPILIGQAVEIGQVIVDLKE